MDGGTIAMHGMASGLKKAGAHLEVAALNTLKHHVDTEKLPQTYLNEFKMEAVDADTSVKILPALRNLAGKGSYNIDRFDINGFHELLRRKLQNDRYDIVQLESLFMAPYIGTIRECSDARICLRSHNVEHIIWERMADNEKNPFRRWYLRFLSKRLKRYELSIFDLVDCVLCISEDDAELYRELGYAGPMEVISIGLDPERYADGSVNDGVVSFFHLASMDWLPNQEAVDWYIRDVHPQVCQISGDIRVHLAGRAMPRRIKVIGSSQLIVHDKIDDAASFMKDKQVMIVPLLSGSGVRVKIIEGLAMGKTIISTSIGAEGIAYSNGENMIIADTPSQFSGAMAKCYDDPEYCRSIGRNGRELFERSYSDVALGNKTLQFYRHITKK